MIDRKEETLNSSQFSLKRVVLRTALFLCACVLAAVIWLALYGLGSGPETDAESVVVEFPPGTSLRGIGKILAEAGVVHEDIRFTLLTKLFGYSGRIRAGEFKVITGKSRWRSSCSLLLPGRSSTPSQFRKD